MMIGRLGLSRRVFTPHLRLHHTRPTSRHIASTVHINRFIWQESSEWSSFTPLSRCYQAIPPSGQATHKSSTSNNSENHQTPYSPSWDSGNSNFVRELQLMKERHEKEWPGCALIMPNGQHVSPTKLGDPPEDRIVDASAEWWYLGYHKQLNKKRKCTKKAIQHALEQLIKENPVRRPRWIDRFDFRHRWLPIVPSPVLVGYRNRVDFTIGFNEDGQPEVGQRLGSFKKNMCVAPVTKCPHIPEEFKEVAAAVKEYLVEEKEAPYDIVKHTGYWRTITLRTSKLNPRPSGTICLVANVQRSDWAAAPIQKMANFLNERFGPDSAKPLFTGCLVMCYTGVSAPEPNTPEYVLWGSPLVEEKYFDCRLSVFGSAFSQPNPALAQQLYGLVRTWALDGAHPGNLTVIDVCSGAGPIGILIAKSNPSVRVIGLELDQSAVEIAHENASSNGVGDRVEFIQGDAQETIHQIKFDPNEDIVAVVDPPRTGLAKTLIHMLRTTWRIQKVVYVSCNYRQLKTDLLKLCKPWPHKRMKHRPFKLTRAIPMDMFPHTSKLEVVVELVRLSSEEMEEFSSGDHERLLPLEALEEVKSRKRKDYRDLFNKRKPPAGDWDFTDPVPTADE